MVGQDLEHYISLLCCCFALTRSFAMGAGEGERSRRKGLEMRKGMAHQGNIHSSFRREKKVLQPIFLKLELQTNVEGVRVVLLDPISDFGPFGFSFSLSLTLVAIPCCVKSHLVLSAL